MRLIGDKLLNYDEYLDLQTKQTKTFNENQRQGFLAKQLVCDSIFRFKFLDKPVLMTLLNFDKSNNGGFYRIMKNLQKENVVKALESKYTTSKTVYALKPKAFRTYLKNKEPFFYPKSNDKLGIGVKATHNLTTANMMIRMTRNTYLKYQYLPNFVTERELRATADYLPRMPDGFINISENDSYFIEYEFSEKNRRDRINALVNADRNVSYLLDDKYESEEYTVETIWYVKNQRMKNLYEREIKQLAYNGINVLNFDNILEFYQLNKKYHHVYVMT
ncbi:hypothetical protein JCM30760_09950 [Thiomicrorhabdus hydrogeniphila]